MDKQIAIPAVVLTIGIGKFWWGYCRQWLLCTVETHQQGNNAVK
jgi:hypothetical protein